MSEQTEQIIQTLAQVPAIPIVRSSSPEAALWAAQTILSSGWNLVELTWTIPQANEVIAQLRKEFPTASIGVGSILSEAHYEAAQLAGGDWFVTPMLDEGLVQAVQSNGGVLIPGVLTPTEVYRGCLLGVPAMKVFPISSMGGVSYLKSLLEPFGHTVQQPLQLMACGGIGLEEVTAYKQAGALSVGLGKSLVSNDILNRRDGDLLRSRLSALSPLAV